MRTVKVHESAGLGDIGNRGRWGSTSLDPSQFPFFFETLRYFYGAQLASKLIAEFKRHGGSIPFSTIYRRMRNEGVERWDADAILDAIAHPSPTGFGFVGKKNQANLGQLGISKKWKERIRKFRKIAIPVAAIVGAAFIPGVGSALLKIGKSVGGSVFKAFGGGSFGTQKAAETEQAITTALSDASQEESISEPDLIEKVMSAVVDATGIKPDEVLRGLIKDAINQSVPSEYQTQTTRIVDQVTDTYVDDRGNVVGQESRYLDGNGREYTPPRNGNGGFTLKTEHLLIGGGFLFLLMMMTMMQR
jgi:hypothetical protein